MHPNIKHLSAKSIIHGSSIAAQLFYFTLVLMGWKLSFSNNLAAAIDKGDFSSYIVFGFGVSIPLVLDLLLDISMYETKMKILVPRFKTISTLIWVSIAIQWTQHSTYNAEIVFISVHSLFQEIGISICSLILAQNTSREISFWGHACICYVNIFMIARLAIAFSAESHFCAILSLANSFTLYVFISIFIYHLCMWLKRENKFTLTTPSYILICTLILLGWAISLCSIPFYFRVVTNVLTNQLNGRMLIPQYMVLVCFTFLVAMIPSKISNYEVNLRKVQIASAVQHLFTIL
jgi:hypothetical protein